MQSDQIFQGKKILLVEDDELFREVLTGTLVELGFKVLSAENGATGLEIFKGTKDLSLILSDIRMPRMDGVALLSEIRKTSTIPFILQTGFSQILEAIHSSTPVPSGFLAKPFTIAELKRALNHCLAPDENKELTPDDDFARIAISDFISGKILEYNIYVRLGKDRFVKIAYNGEDLDIERVRGFRQRGIRHLFLRKVDFREYLQKNISLAKRVSAAKTIDIEKRLRFLRHTGSLVVEKTLVEDVDNQALSAAKDFFQTSLDIISEQDDLLNMLAILSDHSDHTYAHSVGVSIYAIMIAQAIGWTSNPTVFRVGLAGLLHDIGLKEIDKDILDMPRSQMDRRTRALYETHPARGADILASSLTIPEEVVQAIMQHHEDPHGFGYPRGIKGKDITPLASLIQVSDLFCKYTIKNPDYPNGMTAALAIEKMEQQQGDILEKVYLEGLKSLITVADSTS